MWHDLDEWLESEPAPAAVARLASSLEAAGDLPALFQALLLGERLRLGLPAVMPADDAELPEAAKQAYEQAIRDTARRVGQHFLDRGDLAGGWPYFRLIGQLAPIAAALEAGSFTQDDEIELALHLAIQEQAHPVWGYRLLLRQRGLCSAITTFGQGPPAEAEVRRACIGLLIDELHAELAERLRSDLAGRRGAAVPPETSIAEMLDELGPLGEDDFAHIDLSHLSSVLQYAVELPRGSDFIHLLELCDYGVRLPARWQPLGDPPFDHGLTDYRHYFRTLAGIDVEAGVEHFRAKAEAQAGPDQTAPAEVLIHLLAEWKRYPEAQSAFGRYLAQADRRALACISAEELACRSGDYAGLASLAQRRGDFVGYAAACLAGRLPTPK